jgi:hypothetical protein
VKRTADSGRAGSLGVAVGFGSRDDLAGRLQYAMLETGPCIMLESAAVKCVAKNGDVRTLVVLWSMGNSANDGL